MTYKEYPEIKETYVVVQNSGFGVQEAPYEEVGVVFSTNDKEEAYKKAEELKIANNSPEDIKSSWVPNTYCVNINTSSEEGKKLSNKFSDAFREMWDRTNNDSRYKDYIDNSTGITIRLMKNPMFDEK